MTHNLDITIKQIEKNESEFVIDLFNKYRIFYNQASDLNLAKTYIQNRLNNDESVIFVAFINETPIGFTQLYPNYSSIRAVKNWILNDLYVEKEYRNLGVGKRLIDTVISFANQNEANSIELSTAIDNKTAQSLYEKIGFEQQTPDNQFYTYSLVLRKNNLI